MTPTARALAGRPAAPATALTMSGPTALPESANRRQPARNCERPQVGETSAPRVMTIPDETPLPTPSRAATSAMVAAWWVSGRTRRPALIVAMAGSVTQRRPRRSMMRPPGKKRRTSQPIDME